MGSNDRGVAPKDDLTENPARWAGLGKRPGALPLRIVIHIRKIVLALAYWFWDYSLKPSQPGAIPVCRRSIDCIEPR